MLLGLVLAGGASTRMGSPKALLNDDRGEPFVVRVSASMIAAGLERLVIVSGREHESIVAALDARHLPSAPKVVRNPDPSRGQLSSLWVGMDEIVADTEALVVTLVDVPLVRPSTIRSVIEAWRRTRAPIVRPAVGVRRGHPVVFDRSVFDELRQAPLEQGARVVVRAHADRILDLPVDDPGCIVDIDTPADYDALLRTRQKPAD
jgi:CTP:molybdopterin cytidylyltransferase MocA